MLKTYKASDDSQLSLHFNIGEFKCKCGKAHDTPLDDNLVSMLEKLYTALDCSKIIVSSGYRCSAHDKAVGGNGSGFHTKGMAADICCYAKSGAIISSKIVCCTAQDLGFGGIANINSDYTYTHVDVRAGGRWLGNEIVSYNTVTDDFYKYFGIPRKDGDIVEPFARGIDVSVHQGKIDWSKVVSDFAILRAGYGKDISQKDAQFEANYSGAKAAGIPVGAYWYSYATTTEEAEKEAECFLSVLKGKKFEYPVWFDIEEERQLKLGKDKVSAIIKAFLNKVESAGYWAGLYMSASPLQTYVTDDIRNRYAVWVANVGVSKPSYNGAYGMWQYSWKGRVNGISGDVDLDYCYVDYPSKIKSFGLNGFGKEPEPDKPAEKKTIVAEIEIGGVKYKGTLTEI